MESSVEVAPSVIVNVFANGRPAMRWLPELLNPELYALFPDADTPDAILNVLLNLYINSLLFL